MLKLEKVTGGYANIPVLKDVTFEVADGELVGLIGLNGAGKSTTIMFLCSFELLRSHFESGFVFNKT